MSKISIVTAFFDIGRGFWTPEKGLPHYLQRSNETYIERFSHLLKLETDITVFTSKDMEERLWREVGDRKFKTTIVPIDLSVFAGMRERIREVQQLDSFKSSINPSQIKNPEYWSADYVLVNMLKSHFVNHAIGSGVISTDLVAWLDFGYCREDNTLNNVKLWNYPFNKEKIHFFNIKDYTGTSITDIIANNDVHITGPCIVASQSMWPELEKLVDKSFRELLDKNLIDDDQTLLLMSYLTQPDSFELHPISPNDWFIAFRKYNENIS